MKTHRSTTQLAKKCLATLLPSVVIAGCMVGPDYKKPEITPPNTFRAQLTTGDAQSFADLPWWSVFGDKALQGLINEALANNYDLQIAVARIEQARALVGVAQSEAKPQIGYQASAQGTKGFVPQDDSVKTETIGTYTGVLEAVWEFDIWGRIRHSTDAARANLFAQEDVRRGVTLTLVSDIAANYFQLIGLDQELAIAEESARVYKKTLDLFTLRFEAGKDSRLPVERAQAAYDSSSAAIQDLKRLIGQQENAISILVGGYPKAIARGRPLQEQSAPQTPLGSTTALLQRRPDVLQAEQSMIKANAEIGVAVANFFPRIGLSAFVGGQGASISDNFQGFGVWNIALSMTGPIFSGGRLEETYHERQAYWDETVAQYKKTVLAAFHETSDALVAQQTLVQRRTALLTQVQALQHSSDLALDRYQAGRANYFEILEAQQQLFPAQDALAQTDRDQLLAVVSLYKALGGGWNDQPGEKPGPAAGPVASLVPSASEKQ